MRSRYVVPLSLLALSVCTSAHAGEDVSALLKAQTQAFSEAGKRGDAALMQRYLSDEVVFFNEAGDRATKKDLVEGATPPPPGSTPQTITTTDWDCKVHGDVAVTSFIDVLDQGTGTQRVRFRSVETWRREGRQWRMISSETLTLQDDPAATMLDAKTLDEYAGTYSAGKDLTFTFTRQGSDLMASVNGGPPTPQKAETRDVVFTPGQARGRKVFQRDGAGKVIGFVYLRPGQDLLFKRV
jgi:ketosteroid isomerase-like protein